MTNIIFTILVLFSLMTLNGLSIVGLFLSMQEGMLLGFIRKYGDRVLSEKWRMPFYDCPTCMASVHSTYFYWGAYLLLTSFDYNINIWVALLVYPAYITALAAMATIIYNNTQE